MSVTKNTNDLLYKELSVYVTSTSGTMLSGNHIGSIKDAKVTISREYLKHESGFPVATDLTVPVKEGITIEGKMEEMSPYNLALAFGLDPLSYSATTATFNGGNLVLPATVQMWAVTQDAGGQYITFKLWKANSESAFEFNPANGAWAAVNLKMDGLLDNDGHASSPLYQLVISDATPFSG